jgi:uncharacterized protein (TIGR03435 family)
MCFYNPQAGKLVMMQSTLDSLAQQLETILGAPVVNEAGLPGKFDANFDLTTGDVEATRTALEKNLGLTLIKASRSIDKTILDPLPTAPKVIIPETPGKTALVPGQLVQTIAVAK